MTIKRVDSSTRGEPLFKTILPEEIEWRSFAAFPPSVELAVVVGQPCEPGPYVVRVKVPAGAKLMPHKHPEDRVYTVISGVFYIGLGDTFDASVLVAFPPGAVVVLPGGTSHFHWARSGEYVTQVTGTGPLGLEYVVPSDDPRTSNAGDASSTRDNSDTLTSRRRARDSETMALAQLDQECTTMTSPLPRL